MSGAKDITSQTPEAVVYKLQVPVTIAGKLYEKVTLKPLKTKQMLKFKTNATGERKLEEWVETISASANLEIGVIEEFDFRDTCALITEVSEYMLPFPETSSASLQS